VPPTSTAKLYKYTSNLEYVDEIDLLSNTSEIRAVLGLDGTIFVAHGGYLSAINPNTMEIKWGPIEVNGIQSTPTVGADGTVYVPAGDGIIGLDPETGDQRTRWIAGDHATHISLAPDVIGDGSKGSGGLFTMVAGTLVWLKIEDGDLKKQWSLDVGTGVMEGFTVDKNGTVYITRGVDGRLYAIPFHTTNPEKILLFETPTNPINDYSRIAIGSDGTIYWAIGQPTDKLYALSPN
jgi:outer membrane protein assembly factor BamB